MKYICGYFLISFVFVTVINGGPTLLDSIDSSEESSEESGHTCILIKEDGNELTEDEWKNGIRLPEIDDVTEVGTILVTFKEQYIYIVDSVRVNNQRDTMYVRADTNKHKLYVSLNRNFENYEHEQTATEMEIKVTLECENGNYKDLLLFVPIHDTNNHDPEFLKAPYEFTLQMPLSRGFDFDMLKSIVVRDVDLTNERITLKIEDPRADGFSLTSGTTTSLDDKKNYLSKFVNTVTQDLTENITFNISATDSGTPSRTSYTTVTIRVDGQNSYPRFAQPLYTADLMNFDYLNSPTTVLSFVDNANVTLIRGYDNFKNLEIRGISEENKKHFKLTYHGSMSDYGVECFIAINNFTTQFLRQRALLLHVVATVDYAETHTVVNVILPDPISSNASDPNCEIHVQKVTGDEPSNGYMIATIIFSITSVILSVCIIYLFLRRNK